MVTKLVVASGKSAGRTIAIKRNRLLIGRAEECDVRPLSEDVSRRHCEVLVGPADVWIQDLGSRNGTFVNGKKIAEKTKLADGDLIRVGALELKVSCTDPAAKAGSEDDVSRWLMADDQPAGMFDTTRTVPDATSADASAGRTRIVPTGADDASSSSVLDSSIHAGAADAASDISSPSGVSSTSGISSSSIHLEALKAGRGKPGALPQQQPQKKAADSSRDAAAEALKKFFDNR
jgi:pSer/pThr/pTyr-binding forkhead associated (FHA) protein